jgi:hypothetical protein
MLGSIAHRCRKRNCASAWRSAHSLAITPWHDLARAAGRQSATRASAALDGWASPHCLSLGLWACERFRIPVAAASALRADPKKPEENMSTVRRDLFLRDKRVQLETRTVRFCYRVPSQRRTN